MEVTMEIAPFALEQYFALFEFNVPYNLCASDCETMSVADLLALAGQSPEALGSLTLGYTESQGDPALRAAIAATYEDVSAAEVVYLAAPEEGIYLLMRTLLAAGDEVVVLSPAYDSLRNVAAHICGAAHVHSWPLQPDDGGWRLDLEGLQALLTPETRLLIVNFPHNPTGYLPTVTQFEEIIALARRHDLRLFCDEMYRGLEMGGSQRLPSAVDRYERAIVLSGLSKVHGLPGLRAGWLVLRDAAMRDRLINWKHYTTICAPAPSEFLALAALQTAEQLAGRSRTILAENLALADRFFTRWSHLFTWRRPQAGSVALVGVNVPSATAYCEQLITTAGVLLLPGPYLGYDDRHVRFGFGRGDFAAGLNHYETHLEKHEGI
jgi:aspartate/methionine/tyrosine aminotransferase